MCRLTVCVCVCVVLHSREDHLHRNGCFASDGPAWLGGPGQEVHLCFLSAAGQRTLPRQEAAAGGWGANIKCSQTTDALSASFAMVTRDLALILSFWWNYLQICGEMGERDWFKVSVWLLSSERLRKEDMGRRKIHFLIMSNNIN